jgi:hypothetical protein
MQHPSLLDPPKYQSNAQLPLSDSHVPIERGGQVDASGERQRDETAQVISQYCEGEQEAVPQATDSPASEGDDEGEQDVEAAVVTSMASTKSTRLAKTPKPCELIATM